MPKIRLNKAIKEFNISLSRAVTFLQEKGFDIDNNPNALLEDTAYVALNAAFARDGRAEKNFARSGDYKSSRGKVGN